MKLHFAPTPASRVRPTPELAAPLAPRPLGHTGLTGSALALGCARLGSTLAPLSRRQSLALLREALDLGIRHFDTANVYGQGDSERYLGAALRSRRGEVLIATKAGQRLSALQTVAAQFKRPIGWLARRRPDLRGVVARRRADGLARCFEPAHLVAALEESLRRLGTDYVDLFYLHAPAADALADERLEALAEKLKREGKIRAFGVSCDDPETALAAARHPAVEVVQFDPAEHPSPAWVLTLAHRHGKAVLARGVARRIAFLGLGPAALGRAMHATLALPTVAGLIVGTSDLDHLRDNVRAFQRRAPRTAPQRPTPAYVRVGSRRMVWVEGEIPPELLRTMAEEP